MNKLGNQLIESVDDSSVICHYLVISVLPFMTHVCANSAQIMQMDNYVVPVG